MLSRYQSRRSYPRPLSLLANCRRSLGADAVTAQTTADGIPTFWIARESAHDALAYLKEEVAQPYRMLYDLTAIDERMRAHPEGPPASDFTLVYHLLSFDRNEYVRIKVPLNADSRRSIQSPIFGPPRTGTNAKSGICSGSAFDGHPHLERILMPKTWVGHPLRKDHPARATEMGPFQLPDEKQDAEQEALRFRPEDWGMQPGRDGEDFIFLNVGPQHPGTHGVLRVILQLDGEEIVDAVPDIGFHHRGAEKMGERQSWHTYIPYTDRIDYLGGVMNNMAYLMAVEKLAGIEVPPRAQVIRVMLAELFRIISHLVWYGTFAQDLGQLSPVFYTFNDRERAFGIIEAICGARMHPNWFRIGGVAQDLPKGWDGLIRDFLKYLPPRLTEYDKQVMQNRIFKGRTQGVGAFTKEEAIEWGVTGPGLRACGFEWDFRKKQPYSGYEHFEFDIPTGTHGDCYDRGVVRVEEMRQSLRIIEQCVNNMPEGTYKSLHPLAMPASQRTHHARHRNPDHAFSGRELGAGDPAGRSAGRDRGHEGQQRLLPGERRQHDFVPDAHPHAVVSRTCRCCRSSLAAG